MTGERVIHVSDDFLHAERLKKDPDDDLRQLDGLGV